MLNKTKRGDFKMKSREYDVLIGTDEWCHCWSSTSTLKKAIQDARDVARAGCAWLEQASLYKSELDDILIEVYDQKGNLKYCRRLSKNVKDYILKHNPYLR
jgi:hypothetical protein